MAARHGDIIDTEIALVSSTQHKAILGGGWLNHMDDSARVFLLAQTFKHQVVSGWLVVLHQVVRATLTPNHERVGLLADFAFETLPVEGREVWRVLGLSLDL